MTNNNTLGFIPAGLFVGYCFIKWNNEDYYQFFESNLSSFQLIIITLFLLNSIGAISLFVRFSKQKKNHFFGAYPKAHFFFLLPMLFSIASSINLLNSDFVPNPFFHSLYFLLFTSFVLTLLFFIKSLFLTLWLLPAFLLTIHADFLMGAYLEWACVRFDLSVASKAIIFPQDQIVINSFIFIGTLLVIIFYQKQVAQDSIKSFQDSIKSFPMSYHERYFKRFPVLKTVFLISIIFGLMFYIAMIFKKIYPYNYNVAGHVLTEQSQTDPAIRFFNKSLEIDNNNVQANLCLGVIRFAQGAMNEAYEHFKKAYENDYNNATIHYYLGIIGAYNKDTESAIYHLSESVRLDPKNADAHDNLGAMFVNVGKIDEAVFHFKQAIALKPDHKSANEHLQSLIQTVFEYARRATINNRLDKAEMLYKKLLDFSPEQQAFINSLLAQIYEKQREMQ